MTTETIQTIYTLISHAEGKCSGCLNVTYEAGDDQIKIFCNQCGAIPAAQPAPQTNSVFAGLPNALAREIQDECKHLTCAEGVAFVQSKLDEVSNLSFEAGKVAAQPAPGWISVKEKLPELKIVIDKDPLPGRNPYNYEASDWVQTYHESDIWPGSSFQGRYKNNRILHYPDGEAKWIHPGVTAWQPLPAPPEPAQGKEKA